MSYSKSFVQELVATYNTNAGKTIVIPSKRGGKNPELVCSRDVFALVVTELKRRNEGKQYPKPDKKEMTPEAYNKALAEFTLLKKGLRMFNHLGVEGLPVFARSTNGSEDVRPIDDYEEFMAEFEDD